MGTFVRKANLHRLLNVTSKKTSEFNKIKSKFQARWISRNTKDTRTNFSRFNRGTNCLHTSIQLNKTIAFKLSDIGEGIREVVIKEWYVKVGDRVSQFDNICEVQSDKAAVTITSRYDGVLTKLYGDVDDVVLVGNPLVDIDVEDPEEAEGRKSTDNESPSPSENESRHVDYTPDQPRAKVLTTPAVRRIASQYNLNLNAVKATGKNGRVLKEDVLKHLNMTSDETNVDSAASVHAQSLHAYNTAQALGQDRVVPVSGFTKAMVKSMTESLKIPHFGLGDEYDVTELVKMRAELKAAAASRGVKLTYMPFILKAASLALNQYPILNSSLDANCQNITYKATHNIGVAMDTPHGLVVPVIKNVQAKTVLEIGAELNKLQELGSQGKLGLEHVSGGTFTISNIGNVGGTYTNPVILAPQVSIGALGKIQVLPRFDGSGGVRAAHIVNVSWSADHRVIDGVTMAKFSNALKFYLEKPATFIIDL